MNCRGRCFSCRTLCVLLAVCVWTAAFFFLKAEMGYMLCYMEQRQIFLFSASCFTDLCSRAGGTAIYLANFCTQFMVTPTAGSLTVTVCSILTAVFLYATFHHTVRSVWLLPSAAIVSYIPVILMNHTYGFETEVAVMMSSALSALQAHGRIPSEWVKTTVWSIVTALFYYLIGPGIFIGTVLILINEILESGKNGLKMLVLPAVVSLCGIISIKAGLTGTYGSALTLSAYRADNGVRKENSRYYELEYLTCRQEWDDILECIGGTPRNYVESNYMNLALAEKGILADSLLHYPQKGPYSLVNSNHGKDELSMVTLAHILYAAGDYAGAQSMAFSVSADRKFSFSHPYMMKIVRDVDMIRGSLATVDRYDRMFSKTLHYSHWAGENSLSERMVKSFGVRDYFSLYRTPDEDFREILDADPENSIAAQYAVSYAVLTKDIREIRSFIERYYDTPAMDRTLPRPVSEALLFFADYYSGIDEEFASAHGMSGEELKYMKSLDGDYLRRFDISREVVENYTGFKDKFDRYGISAPPFTYYEFRNTFWYYLLFVKI